VEDRRCGVSIDGLGNHALNVLWGVIRQARTTMDSAVPVG
jgi:hypothetical protein